MPEQEHVYPGADEQNTVPIDNTVNEYSHVEPLIDDPEKVRGQESWLKRHMLKLSLGAFVLATGVGVAVDPLEQTKDKLLEAAPWVAGGLVTTETLWIGGAAIAMAAAGKKIGNPFKLRSRWEEVKLAAASNKMTKTGIAINTVGAVGSASVVAAGAITSLPPETWPGALGIATVDVLGTIAIRKGIYSGMKNIEQAQATQINHETKSLRPRIRHASIDDIERLAEIDLIRFRKAYGENLPKKEEVVEMLTKRFYNSPEWMYVVEVAGQIEGFVSAFRTSKPLEEFTSWEDSTANGTLENRVDPKGKYVYITNMTVNPEATELGGEDMLMANLFAKGISKGIEYGYFVSRMPLFRKWLDIKTRKEGMASIPTGNALTEIAEEYVELRRPTREGDARFDYELRMYEEAGFKLERVVPNAFSDSASLDFGVIFRADVPPHNRALKHLKPIRSAMAMGLRFAARKPNLLKKVL